MSINACDLNKIANKDCVRIAKMQFTQEQSAIAEKLLTATIDCYKIYPQYNLSADRLGTSY